MASQYKFYYFPGRGLGEITRQLFHLADVKFEDIRIPGEEWPQHKEKMPFQQMPVLEVDGQQIPQSIAIARYVARKFGFAGKTPIEEALVDAIADQYKDFYVEIKNYYYPALGIIPADEATVEKAKNEIMIPARDKFLKIMTNFLKKSSSGFLVGGDLTFADLILAEHVTTIQRIFPDYVDNFPEVAAHTKKVQAVPKLKQWLDSRPVTPF